MPPGNVLKVPFAGWVNGPLRLAAMMIVPLILAATASVAAGAAAEGRGAQVASATVRAEILRPAIVRQTGGLLEPTPDAPRPRIVRRDGLVLIEFQ